MKIVTSNVVTELGHKKFKPTKIYYVNTNDSDQPMGLNLTDKRPCCQHEEAFGPKLRHCVFYGVESWSGVLERSFGVEYWSEVDSNFRVENGLVLSGRTANFDSVTVF